MSFAQNPLINPPQLPHGAPAFNQVRYYHFSPAVDWALALAQADIDAIKDNPALPSFENTIEALEFAGADLGRVSGIYHTFTNSKSNKTLRKLQEKIDDKLDKFSTGISLDEVLFARVDAVYQARATLNLDPEQSMLLEKTHRGFVRNGALLNPADKQRFGEISERLTALTLLYSNNDMEATEAYKRVVDDEAELDGVPERAKEDYKRAAKEAGMPDKWLILLEPHPSDILTHATNRALREEISNALWAVGSEAGPHDNRPVILEIVALRQEAAQLLGYKTHAEYVLADRMAGSQKTVEDFLQRNLQAYKPSAVAYLDELKAYALQADGITDFKPWDTAYYGRILKEQKYDLKMEDLRPYFDLKNVLAGLSQHAEKLFNVQMKPADGKYPVYNRDVKAYEICDKTSGETIGLFYANYYAKPGVKRGGAWMNAIRDRGLTRDGQTQIPIVTNDCNYTRPGAKNPSLLSLDDVETVYHEFGHALHALCAKGKYPSLNGTNVKWDWVELPSQLQENWVQQKEVLDSFARDPKTKEPMPQALFQKVKDMQNYGSGFGGLRQTFLGMLDMKWHTTDPATITSVEDLEDSVFAVASLLPREKGTYSGGFSHLFSGGYDAGYYSYKWAEVLEADVFERFIQNGLYDQATAKGVLNHIYEAGGKTDPAELYRQLMGRDPDPQALFRREGLAANNNAAPKKGTGTAPQP